jgi:Ran GTPase-activating protein (RanGAP) involved in mRNA processing and transport
MTMPVDSFVNSLDWFGALPLQLNLLELDLSHTGIGASGAASIARALMRHSTLRQLDLSGNHIGESGAWLLRNHSNVHF